MDAINDRLGFRILLPFAWLYLALMLTAPASAQTRAKLEKELRKIIKYEPEIKLDKVKGYSIGILNGDSTYIFNYGYHNAAQNLAIDSQTQFELGGLTKVFTAALVEILMEEGLLHVDSSLQTYLPALCHNPGLAHLTVKDVLSHRSGFPKMPDEFGLHQTEVNNPYAHYRKTQLLDYYRNFQAQDTAVVYHYSHINYALLEIVCEMVSKKDFGTLLKEKLFSPLGMDQTTLAGMKNMAQGHSINGQEVAPWQFSSFAAAEGLKSSMQDLLYFVRLQLSGGNHQLVPLLQRTQEKMIETDYSKWVAAAKGWHIVERRRFPPTIAHTGTTSGFRAFAAFIPDTQTAVVILSNSEASTGGLGYHILRMLNGNWKRKKRK